jgi:hypothetical protein
MPKSKVADEGQEASKEKIKANFIAILEAAEDNDVESLKRLFEENFGSHEALRTLFTLNDSSKRTPMHLVKPLRIKKEKITRE